MTDNEFRILYNIAKKKIKGDRIACPMCGTVIIKEVHQRMFCSNICKKNAVNYRRNLKERGKEKSWKR